MAARAGATPPADATPDATYPDMASFAEAATPHVVREERRPAAVVAVAPVLDPGAERLPAAMLDLDQGGRLAVRQEPDLDLGRVGAVAAEVPQVDESARRLPDRDLAPLVLDAGRRPLEDPATGPRLEDDSQSGLAGHRVVGRPPLRDARRSRRRTRGRPGRPPRRRAGSARSPVGRRVLGDEPEPRRRLAPDPLEVAPDLVDPLVVESVDPPRPARFLDDEPRLLEQAQVARDRRPADRQRVGELLDGSVAGPAAFRRSPAGSGRPARRTGRPPPVSTIARIRLFLASWVTSASPSASISGGMYTPNRPRRPFLSPYQPPTGLSSARPHASTDPSGAGFCSSAPPSGIQSPCALSIAWRSSIARLSYLSCVPPTWQMIAGGSFRVVEVHRVLARAGRCREPPGIGLRAGAGGRHGRPPSDRVVHVRNNAVTVPDVASMSRRLDAGPDSVRPCALASRGPDPHDA